VEEDYENEVENSMLDNQKKLEAPLSKKSFNSKAFIYEET